MQNTPAIPELWKEHDQKVKKYERAHLALKILSSAVSLLFFIWVASKGREIVFGQFELLNPYLGFGISFLLLGLIAKVISLPFSVLHENVEKSYKLSKQTWKAWSIDQIKATIVGGFLGVVVLGLIVFSIQNFEDHWWLTCALLLIFFSIVLAQLAPVLLIPIFYKMKPLENTSMREKLIALSKEHGVKVDEVYHLGLGEKTEKGNAAFLGLGKTKRIVIGDTLYEKFPYEEIEAVFAHELGHQVHWDLWRGISLSAVSILVGFFVANWICQGWVFDYFKTHISDAFGFFIFSIVLSFVQKPFGLLQVLLSRHMEWQADEFSGVNLKRAVPLADALERLCIQNFSRFKPNALIEFFTFSHPAPWRRISKLRAR